MTWAYLLGGYGITAVALMAYRAATALRQKQLRREWEALHG